MDIHKDCYSAIDLTRQDGPHRRETTIEAANVMKPWMTNRMRNPDDPYLAFMGKVQQNPRAPAPAMPNTPHL
jgi:hypothetical protein